MINETEDNPEKLVNENTTFAARRILLQKKLESLPGRQRNSILDGGEKNAKPASNR